MEYLVVKNVLNITQKGKEYLFIMDIKMVMVMGC